MKLFSFLQKKELKQTIISLGSNCFVRSVLTRHGLIQDRRQGYLSCPFDLCHSYLKAIIHFVDTNFEDYFEDVEWLSDMKCYYNSKFTTYFIHDSDLPSKELFIKRYKKRITNYKKVIQNANNKNLKLTFIYLVDQTSTRLQEEEAEAFIKNAKAKIELLYQTLEKRCKNFDLVIIDTIDCIKEAFNNNDIKLIKVSAPSIDYINNWFKEEYFNSNQGKLYEGAIIKQIKEIITKESWDIKI